MNPAIGSISAISIDVRVDRETVLPGRVWCAERPRALLAIVHGLGEHSGRYSALASDLARALHLRGARPAGTRRDVRPAR